jgi:MFS family permease
MQKSASRTNDPPHLPLTIRLLHLSAFLMNIGLFAILPFLAVYLSATLHEPAWQVGTVLGMNMICARALPLLTGPIGDRTSYIRMIILGTLIQGLGYLGYLFFRTFPLLLVCAFCTGTGTAIYSASAKALMSRQLETIRAKAFTGLNMALNAGAIIGPLLGSLLLLLGSQRPFLLGSILFLALAILFFFLRHAYPTQQPETRHSSHPFAGYIVAWQQKDFLAFLGILLLFWIVYTQLTVSLPLYMFLRTHQNTTGGLLISVNGLSGLLFMLLLARQFQRRRPLMLLGIGLFCAGLGWLLLPLFPSFFWSISAVVMYTLGETLALPASDLVTAKFAHAEHVGTFFGLTSLSWAIGGSIGSYLGPWLVGMGNTRLPWIVFGGLGLLASLLFVLLDGVALRRLKSSAIDNQSME